MLAPGGRTLSVMGMSGYKCTAWSTMLPIMAYRDIPVTRLTHVRKHTHARMNLSYYILQDMYYALQICHILVLDFVSVWAVS